MYLDGSQIDVKACVPFFHYKIIINISIIFLLKGIFSENALFPSFLNNDMKSLIRLDNCLKSHSFEKLKISQSFPHIKYTSFDENRAFKMNFFDKDFFHMNFDLANGCKNECKGNNGKSCS